MGFVGQLVRRNILCKKTVRLLEIPSEMKWGHLELHRDLFLWVSTVNEKKKNTRKMKIPHLNCKNTKAVCLFSPVNFSF